MNVLGIKQNADRSYNINHDNVTITKVSEQEYSKILPLIDFVDGLIENYNYLQFTLMDLKDRINMKE